MRSRNEIEKDTESCRADSEDMQALILEVLLDIRNILRR